MLSAGWLCETATAGPAWTEPRPGGWAPSAQYPALQELSPGWLAGWARKEISILSDGGQGATLENGPALPWGCKPGPQMHTSGGTLLCHRLENNFSQLGRSRSKIIEMLFEGMAVTVRLLI